MSTSTFLLPTNPSLSTVQVLSSTNFAPVGFAVPTDGRGIEAVVADLKYAWTEIRRWHRSFAILCDEAEDEDILHIYHLLFSSMFIKLKETSSDAIDKSIREALTPLRQWACTIVRTKIEYDDFMRNVRASMAILQATILACDVQGLSSKHIAEVKTSMDEVAVFLSPKVKRPSTPVPADEPDTQHLLSQEGSTAAPKKKAPIFRRLWKKVYTK